MKNKCLKWVPLLVSILISLGVGECSALLAGNSMKIYQHLTLPPLSPPGIVFPIVWSVLYLLMGISAYLIDRSDTMHKKSALTLYGIQLLLNGLWSLFFFRLEAFGFAFIWLAVLWVFIAATIRAFDPIKKWAALLLIPYLLWVTFAGYLNFMIYRLNG